MLAVMASYCRIEKHQEAKLNTNFIDYSRAHIKLMKSSRDSTFAPRIWIIQAILQGAQLTKLLPWNKIKMKIVHMDGLVQ